jgi:predicted nucleic acid-binding protein
MASKNFTVVYDACILYPAHLRDFLIHLALSHLFKAKWSNEIHREWMENLLKNRTDLKRERLERTRSFMDKALPDALVKKDRYEDLIKSLSLPDKNDRHVLALAIATQSQLIVTFNIKDFPDSSLSKYQIQAIHPDQFVHDLIDLSPHAVVDCIRRQQSFLKNPPVSTSELLQFLHNSGLERSTAYLQQIFSLKK